MHSSPPADDPEIGHVVEVVRRDLSQPWPAAPGGYPDEAEAALVDAVLSIQARYGQAHNGVRGSVTRWRAHRDGAVLDDLAVLAAQDPDELRTILGNRQTVSGGSTKAEAIVHAATALTEAGLRRAADIVASPTEGQRLYTSVRGLGEYTWNYLLMLLGTAGVKADTWIIRFVSTAVARKVPAAEARALLTGAADRLGVSATALDYAVWSHMRSSR